METEDKIERLLKYDVRTKGVTVLLKGLSLFNGMALNKGNNFVLVTDMIAKKLQNIGFKVKNLKLVTLLHDSMENFVLHKIIVEDENSKLGP